MSHAPATRTKTVGAAISAIVLIGINLWAFKWSVVSWMFSMDGDWDQHGAEAIAAAAFIGGALGFIALLLTVVPAQLKWLNKWWYLPPLALLALAVARFVLLDQAQW